MANLDIDYADLNYATGNKTILQLLSDFAVDAARARGNPLSKMTDVSAAVAQKGDVARVIVTATTASSLLTDGGTRVLDDTTPNTVDVTLANNRYIAYATTDLAKVLSNDANAMSLFKGRMAGMLNDIEGDVVQTTATTLSTNVGGTYGSAVTEAVIAPLIASILNQKPTKELFHAFITSATWADLTQIPNFNNAQIRGYLPGEPAPTLSVNYGSGDDGARPWHNTYWHLCQSVASPTISSVVSSNNLIIHPQSVAVAMRPVDAESKAGDNAYVSVPFSDAQAGVAGSIVYARNILTYAEEITIRVLYGYSTTKEVWAGLLKAR